MERPPRSGAYSVERSFVVQLDRRANLIEGPVLGRVEHVVSGRASDFKSFSALASFMATVLGPNPRA